MSFLRGMTGRRRSKALQPRQPPRGTGMLGGSMLGLLLGLLLGRSVPAHATGPGDAGGPEFPLGAAHRALKTGVALLEHELADAQRAGKELRVARLKPELALARADLESVEELYGIRLAACQQHWARLAGVLERKGPMLPGYFACSERVQVTDAMVQGTRRHAELLRRLRDAGTGPSRRSELRKELQRLDDWLATCRGEDPLFVPQPDADGGMEGPPAPWED